MSIFTVWVGIFGWGFQQSVSLLNTRYYGIFLEKVKKECSSPLIKSLLLIEKGGKNENVGIAYPSSVLTDLNLIKYEHKRWGLSVMQTVKTSLCRLSAIKADDEIYVCKICLSHIILIIQSQNPNSVEPDKMAHDPFFELAICYCLDESLIEIFRIKILWSPFF